MIKAIVASLCIAAAASAPTMAQGAPSAPSAAPDSTVKKFAGQWEGSFTSDHMNGGMRLQLGYDNVWKASMTIVAQESMSSEGSSVRVEGNRATWNQEVMGMTCETAATLSGGVLKGEINGQQAMVGFELRRRE